MNITFLNSSQIITPFNSAQIDPKRDNKDNGNVDPDIVIIEDSLDVKLIRSLRLARVRIILKETKNNGSQDWKELQIKIPTSKASNLF